MFSFSHFDNICGENLSQCWKQSRDESRKTQKTQRKWKIAAFKNVCDMWLRRTRGRRELMCLNFPLRKLIRFGHKRAEKFLLICNDWSFTNHKFRTLASALHSWDWNYLVVITLSSHLLAIKSCRHLLVRMGIIIKFIPVEIRKSQPRKLYQLSSRHENLSFS